MALKEKEYLYWLIGIPGIGSAKVRKLKKYAGSFEAVYNMKKQELFRSEILNERECEAVEAGKSALLSRVERCHRLPEKGIQFITPEDADYPERLKLLEDRPETIFFRGKLPKDNLPSAAIVGARNCTEYGKEEAEYLGRELAKAGIQIVSGLAYGIDAAGHKGVLKAGGAAYAVLGNGIDICYPRENYMLYREIEKSGGIISEYEPGIEPEAWRFPARNRIISGLSDAVIVVEARKRSGSLITAELAVEQGKAVFALPGRTTDPLSVGCNELIRDGAFPLLQAADVTEFFGINCKKIVKFHGKSESGLAKTEKMLYSCLDSRPKQIEEIMFRCGLSSGECMAALLKLEMDGYIVRTANQYYMRKLE